VQLYKAATCTIPQSWTAQALLRGDNEAIKKRIVDDPQYVNSNKDGDDPLYLAIEHDSLELVDFMLAHGAQPTQCDDHGESCLMAAVFSKKPNSLQILDRLLQAGIEVRFSGYGGLLCTPLHYAAAEGDIAKACLLLDAGARINEEAVDIDRD